MSDYVDIGFGERLFKKGLKDFDKESFIFFITENQKADRIKKSVDPKKAWKPVEKYLKTLEPKKESEGDK